MKVPPSGVDKDKKLNVMPERANKRARIDSPEDFSDSLKQQMNSTGDR